MMLAGSRPQRDPTDDARRIQTVPEPDQIIRRGEPVGSAFRRTGRIATCLDQGMRPRHPEPLKTFDYIGFHRYFLTFCTFNRARLFTSATPIDLVREQISRAKRECSFAVPAYCFMPDHLHLLIEGKSPSSDGRDFIKRARQYSGYYYSQAYDAKLWQRYGYDHVLRDEEKTIVVARYILNNPIRAGLVERIEDYPYCGSLEWPLEALIDWIRKE